MELKAPFIITSRLLPGLKVDGATISLTYSNRAGHEGRTRYQWHIDLDDGREFSGDDLQSGCQGGSLQAAFGDLLAFLSAFGEAHRPSLHHISENADLFPAELGEWAYLASDELSILGCEIEEAEANTLIHEA